MPTRPLGEPVPDQLGLVARGVVHDDVDVEIGGHVALDRVEKPAELGRAVPLHARADDRARLDVERGEQPNELMPDVDDLVEP